MTRAESGYVLYKGRGGNSEVKSVTKIKSNVSSLVFLRNKHKLPSTGFKPK